MKTNMLGSLRIAAISYFLLSHLCCMAQGSTTNTVLVPLGLAQHVATEHVHANNKPFSWVYLDCTVLYDVDGIPNGYAFIFGKAEGRFKGVGDLRHHITDRTTTAPKGHGQKAQPSYGDKDLFAFDDLATVITGATEESPLILRHFRGAPEFWVEAVKSDVSRGAQTNMATHVVMVTPMDFRLVSTEAMGTAKVAKASERAEVMPLDASGEIISVHSKKANRISELRQKKHEREARIRRRQEAMRPEQRKRYEAALLERKDFLRNQWENKREMWQQAQLEKGEDQ